MPGSSPAGSSRFIAILVGPYQMKDSQLKNCELSRVNRKASGLICMDKWRGINHPRIFFVGFDPILLIE